MYELRQELAKLSLSWDEYCIETDDSAELNNFYSGYQRFFLTNFSTVGTVGDSYRAYVSILREALAQNYTLLDQWTKEMPSGSDVDKMLGPGRLQNF